MHRGVPATRWRRAGHWLETVALTAFVAVGLVPVSVVVWLVVGVLFFGLETAVGML